MVKKILVSCIFLLSSFLCISQSSGLLSNNGSIITVVNGAILFGDSLNNKGLYYSNNSTSEFADVRNSDTIYEDNSSDFIVNNDYLSFSNGAFYSLNLSMVELFGDWNNSVGYFAQDSTGLFRFSGVYQDIAHANGLSGKNDFFGTVDLDGGGVKTSHFNLFCRDLILTNGILAPNSNIDSIVVVTDNPLMHGSVNSHVRDNLFLLVPNTYVSNTVVVPVGSFYAGTNHYTPIEFVNYNQLGVDSSIFQIKVKNTPLTTPQLNGEILSLYDEHYWYLLDATPNRHDPFQVKLHADQSAVGSVEGDWITTQATSDTSSSIFFSLGASDFGTAMGSVPSYVTSNFDASEPFLAIGTLCNTAKLAVEAKMQAIVSPSSLYQSFLDQIYVQGQIVNGYSSSETMFSGSSIDPSTIGLVKVTLRDVVDPSIVVDTTYGWLLSNNEVVDFKTASVPYLEFCPTPGKVTIGESYYVELDHSNHIPIITSSTNNWVAKTVVPTPGDVIDFTQPSTHFSLYGYFPNGAVAEMVGGDASANAYSSSINRIDATDVFLTRWRMTDLPAIDFSLKDANLDGQINVNDYNLVSPNAKAIRRAVLPY